MDEVFDQGKVDKPQIDFNKRPISHDERKHEHQVIWSVFAVVFILFLVLGLTNFQSGRSFNMPERVTYQDALYQTEGEIVEGENLIGTGDKVNDLEIYTEKATPGKTYSRPAHQVYLKAGKDFVVYVLEKKK
jgi:hypothetical protein